MAKISKVKNAKPGTKNAVPKALRAQESDVEDDDDEAIADGTLILPNTTIVAQI